MLYRFKKLFYVWMALMGVCFLVSAKEDPPGDRYDRMNRLSPYIRQTEDAQQGSQSFAASWTDSNSNLNKYIIYGRTRPDGSKIIQIIPLDGHMPDTTANWDQKTYTQPSDTLDTSCDIRYSYCDGHKIWGWTFDEATNLLYTLEQTPDTYDKGSSTDPYTHTKWYYGHSNENASIHMYGIEDGKFVETGICIPDTITNPTNPTCGIDVTRETQQTKDKSITPYFKFFDPSKIIPNTWAMFIQSIDSKFRFTFNYPSVGMAMLDGHLFYVDGHTISSAENGLDASITITGDGYDNTTAPLYFKTLSRVATPNSGDVLIASGPTGNIAIVKFDSTTQTLKQLYSGGFYGLQYLNNFKMAPLRLGATTQYFLTFVAQYKSDKTERRRVIGQRLLIDANNQIDWATILNPMGPPVPYMMLRGSSKGGPAHTIQTLVAVDNTKAPLCTDDDTFACSTQYFTTLYYDDDTENPPSFGSSDAKPPIFGRSEFSAKLFIKRGIDNNSVFGAERERTLSDNLLGVVFGTPPLYSKDTNVIINNTFTIDWATETTNSSSNGFSVNSSLTVGLMLKGGTPFGTVKSDTSFSFFKNYSKNITRSTTRIQSTSITRSQSNDSTEFWANNQGWLLISKGFTMYDAYRLQGVPPNGLDSPSEPIYDYHNAPIVVLSIAPSSDSVLSTQLVVFRLTDGCVKGSNDPACSDPGITPDTTSNWIGYTTGMQVPKSSSIVQNPDSITYWNAESSSTSGSRYLIDNAKKIHVIDSPSDNIQVGAQNGSGGVKFLQSLADATDTTGRIGGSFDEKISSEGNVFGVTVGGSVDFKISSEYNYSSKTAIKNTTQWSAVSATKSSESPVKTMNVKMHLLTLTDATKEKPFWVPNWAWTKGNKPWLLTWTATRGDYGLTKVHNKNSKHSAKASTNIKNKKPVSSPKSAPAQTTSSIN